MDTNYIRVKDKNNLVRDIKSNGIINTDIEEYKQYVENYKKQYNSHQKLKKLESNINDLKNDIDEIKNLLKNLIGKN